jgi:lysophospholipase L1-like esterase
MRTRAVILAVAAMLLSQPLRAEIVPAWAASQQRIWGGDFLFPTNIPGRLENRTLRQVVRMGIGGRDVRVLLSNTYGTRPVTVAGAHVAPSVSQGRIEPSGDRILRFGGAAVVMIAPGASIISDPVPMVVMPGQNLGVSLYFREAPTIESFHWDSRRTGYVFDGDQLAVAAPNVTDTTTAGLLLAGVLVDAPGAKGTIVVMGDSITDGAGATLDADARWPDYLAARSASRGIAVVNAGISGARLLSDGMGSNALARLDRDVLAQPGIRTLVLMLGINDIAWPGTPFDPDAPAMTFEAMVAGYQALVARAHAGGVRVIGATLTPFGDALSGTPLGSTYFSPVKDTLRQRVNDWIRGSGTFDAVMDFDRLLADPEAPGQLAAGFDSGDHLHPGDAGNKAMADAIDLRILLKDNP